MIQCVVCEDWLHGRVSLTHLWAVMSQTFSHTLCSWAEELKDTVSPTAGHSHWSHLCVCLQHLGCVVPDSVELLEMICESCMNQNTFLWTYAAHLAGSS